MLGIGPRSIVSRPPLWLLLSGSAAAQEVVLNGAQTLLDGETQGLAFDFTDSSAYIIDTGTPANNYDSTGIVSSGSLVGPSGKLTYTSPSNKLTRQSDGFIKYQAHNLCLQSETSTNATWTKSGATAADGVADPFGGTTAFTITEDGTTGTHRIFQSLTAVLNAQYVNTFYVKQASGDRDLFVRIIGESGDTNASIFDLSAGTSSDTGTAVSTITAIGSGWYLCTVSASASVTASTNVYYGLRSAGNNSYAGDSASGVTICRPHVYRYPANTDYIKTTSAAKYALPLEYDTSGNCLSLLVEEARTNLCLYSNDLTQAGSWTASNMTTAKTATGPDNVANSATTITASAGNATILQAITSASAARVTSVYIKRRTGTGNIDLTQDNGSTWTTQAVDSTWTRFSLSSVTSANPTVGIRIVTSGDAVDVALFSHEVGAFVTSPIVTYGSASSRLADNISIATSAFPRSDTAESIYCQFSALGYTAGGGFAWVVDGSAGDHDLLLNSTNARVRMSADGTATAFSSPVSGTVYKVSAAMAANDLATSADGATVATDTSATYRTDDTQLCIGSRAGSVQLNGHIKAISYVPRRKTDAELQTETT